MNFRTTLLLLILVGAGALGWWLSVKNEKPPTANAGINNSLNQELLPDKLTKIEVHHAGKQLVLERLSGRDWSLPGSWPTRKQAVDELINTVASLSSTRFTPLEPQTDYGLDKPALEMVVWSGNQQHRLKFGEEQSGSNRFSRATFVQVDENPDVIRLAPGLISILQRPQDYYQQRRLFSSERVAKDSFSQEKVDRLDAQSVAVKGSGGNYVLARKGDEWDLTEPVHDRADPDKLKTVLSSVPDIWAEQFVDNAKKDLAEYGLKNPEQTLHVNGKGTAEITLLIGKNARTKTRTVLRPAPNMGGPPMPPQQEVIHEEYRYAKLAGNEQIFEIKADKLKDVFIDGKTLRDPQLARFRTEEARRLEIKPGNGGIDIVAVKEKDRWRLHKPYETDAEDSKITELLDKLSNLQARDKDVIDSADLKTYGFAGPTATITVTAEEQAKGEVKDAPKKTRTFTFALGKHDTEKKHVYVRTDGYERINAVEDSVLPLVERPALAYRSRRLLDHASSDVARIEVKRPNELFALEQVNGSWRLAAPEQGDVDSSKVFQLANDLGRLEAVEQIAETAAPQALDQTYGLAKPALTAKVSLTDAKKPAQMLLMGKQRPGKPEYFAKLESSPGIFSVKKELRDALDQDSLAYRPQQIWQLRAEDIKEVRIAKAGPEYRLKQEGTSWKVAGPFAAPAVAQLVKPVEDELTNLRCERYAAHAAKDLASFGLDKPYLRISVQEREVEKADKAAAKTAPKERVLLVGKTTDKDAKAHFAKLGDGKAIFVLGEKAIAALDHTALDFLDPTLLALDQKLIQRIDSATANGSLTLERQGEVWRVAGSPAPAFPADGETMAALLGLCSGLRAQHFAAYGGKLDLAAYGLDKPADRITVTLQPSAKDGKPAAPVKHTLTLGKAAGKDGDRYARLDEGPGVAVLGASAVKAMTHGYLDFVNRSVLKFDAGAAQQLERRMDKDVLELARHDAVWQMTKPKTEPADTATISALVDELAALQAKRVAAYPAKDLKSFGLDNPSATVTVRLKGTNSKPAEHVLKLGGQAGNDRYATVDQSNTVVVLPGTLVQRLTAPPLQFRDRNIARAVGIDRISLQRGPRKAVFARAEGFWKMIEPMEAEAEQADLDDFISQLADLRAEQLAAEKPADLKTYGLERPEVHWQAFAGGKSVLDLLVGGEEKGKEPGGVRHYAKLANGDVVFVCSPQLSNRLLGEYRTRTIWPPLDASQVDRLRFGYGENPFVLEKPDNDWHLAGKPGVKVQPEAVREALDGLAGLKAARYVTDKGTDLKLYGLQPPQLVLEIQTRSGPRVLHIGRPEGESKRFYARVPDNDRGSVFIISEADANRIIRPLTTFVQTKAASATKVR
jgi:hypothetical protein